MPVAYRRRFLEHGGERSVGPVGAGDGGRGEAEEVGGATARRVGELDGEVGRHGGAMFGWIDVNRMSVGLGARNRGVQSRRSSGGNLVKVRRVGVLVLSHVRS